MEYKILHDTMGEMKVPASKYWGAQTQRSYENFRIGKDTMMEEIIRAFAVLKKASAMANAQLGVISQKKAELIKTVCDEITEGKLNEHFPLSVFQTGSGTQSNMNVNEVIAYRGNELIGEELLHPNDDVNKSQSSNDTFPTAMHIAAVTVIERRVLPAMEVLQKTFHELSERYNHIIKTGRTHLQDATPLTLGQEISAWEFMLKKTKDMLNSTLPCLYEIALGGTAVGTGLNAPKEFPECSAKYIRSLTGYNFVTAENKFHALTSKDAIVFSHGALKALAADLMKIANDVRMLASGPRSGIGEISIPANEPGSSIMPGKVNPTQCEAMTMVAVQVMGNDAAIGFAASQGNYQLNVFMPVISYNFIQSANLLADVMASFNDRCAVGIKPNYERIEKNLKNSLMLVTALNPYIGYENSAKIAKEAFKENLTLKEAALKLELLTEEEFDRYMKYEEMV